LTEMFIGEKYLDAIGWTLVHAVWQIVLISGLLWAFLLFVPKMASRLRYAAALSALALIFTASCWTFVVQLRHAQGSTEIPSVSVEAARARPEAAFLLSGPDTGGKEAITGIDWAEKVEKY